MNWWWKPVKPTPPPPVIPKFERAPPVEPGIVVEEIDTTDTTATGIMRIIRKWKGEI